MSSPIPSTIPTVGPGTLALLRRHKVETALDVVGAGEQGHAGIAGVGPAKWALLWEWAWGALSSDERLEIARGLCRLDEGTQFDAWLERMPSTHNVFSLRNLYLGEDDEVNYMNAGGHADLGKMLRDEMRLEVEARAADIQERLIDGADEEVADQIRRIYAEDGQRRKSLRVEEAREAEEREARQVASNRQSCATWVAGGLLILLLLAGVVWSLANG